MTLTDASVPPACAPLFRRFQPLAPLSCVHRHNLLAAGIAPPQGGHSRVRRGCGKASNGSGAQRVHEINARSPCARLPLYCTVELVLSGTIEDTRDLGTTPADTQARPAATFAQQPSCGRLQSGGSCRSLKPRLDAIQPSPPHFLGAARVLERRGGARRQRRVRQP